MGTVELSKREIEVLEAFIDNMKEIKLEKTVYRIRNIFVVLYAYFKKAKKKISQQSIQRSVEALENVGLLKNVGKTQCNDGSEESVFELQLERFDQTKIVEIKRRYGKRVKKKGKLPKLGISSVWFAIEPYEPLAPPMSKLEVDLSDLRNKITVDIILIEQIIERKKKEREEVEKAIELAKEAGKCLKKLKKDAENIPRELKDELDHTKAVLRGDITEKELKLLPREKKVLEEIDEYLIESGTSQIRNLKKIIAKRFSAKDIKISEASIYLAARGLRELGLLKMVDVGFNPTSKQKIYAYELNRELLGKAEILVEARLRRKFSYKGTCSEEKN